MAVIRRTNTSFGVVANKAHVQKVHTYAAGYSVMPIRLPTAALPARQRAGRQSAVEAGRVEHNFGTLVRPADAKTPK